jgi:DNA replication and repair protein RecF
VYLKKLSLINFKNCAEAELEFSAQVNCFVGNNGEGKTNLLDAIHYLSFCKSYFNSIDSQNIKHNEPFFVVQGVFEKEEKEENVYCGLKRNQKKKFKRNQKEYSRLADHIGHFPVVMISPYDSDLIAEGSEIRRKFIDSIISQFDRNYLDNLISYNKVVSQRNALLKQFAEMRGFDAESLEIWDAQLIELAQQIYEVRKTFLENFIPIFQEYFELITNGKEAVSITYKSHLNENDFPDLVLRVREKDRAIQYTSVGVHKDDLVLKIGDHTIKKFGSQGQQKSFLIALKLAQYHYIKQEKGLSPILLLDDIFDKLDSKRVKQLMELVTKNTFGQVFITDTNVDRIPDIFENLDIHLATFKVEDGILLN